MKQQADMLFATYGNEILLICSVALLVYILRDIVLILKAEPNGRRENKAPAAHSLLFDFVFLFYLLHMISTLMARIW